jgi:hypothetical protein
MERTRLRNILVILFIILVLLFASWYAYDFFHSRRLAQDDVEEVLKTESDETSLTAQNTEPREQIVESPAEPTPEPVVPAPAAEPAAADPVPEPVKPAEPELIPRHKTGEHTVRKGESFSLITGFYWEDIFLWPDLYIRNSMRSDDPDLIYPDEIIKIYNRLGIGDEFTRRETDEILEAYLQVYRVYKKLGDEKNNSVWSLLWCAARYDHDFLKKYGDRIDPEDRAMAQKYIDEQGFLD